MQYRLVYARVDSGTNACTWRKNLVKIGSVTSEENRLKGGICAATRPEIDDRRLFRTLSFRNGLEYRKISFSGLIVDHLKK